MAVSERDVRHVAALARLGLAPGHIPALVRELNGILAHMDVLQQVDTRDVPPVTGIGAGGMPLRADAGPQYPLARPREAFASAAMRDGFIAVPRLATHVAPDAAAIDDGIEAELEAGA